MKTDLTIKQLREKIAEKSKIIGQISEQAGPDRDYSKVTVLGDGDTTAKLENLRAITTELADLNADYRELAEAENALKHGQALDEEFNKPADKLTFPGKGDKEPEHKSIGQLFVESKAYKQKGVTALADVETKTLFQTSAGWDPEATRIPRVELYPARAITVVDYIPQLPTDRDTIKYMKETTFTNNAAEAAAGGTYGEAALVYTETSDEVEKIGVWLPVTDEQLEDVASIQGLLDSRLTYMLKARLDSQILNGDGSTPNLLGTLNLASLQEQAKGSDPVPDAIYKGLDLVRTVGFTEPTVVFIHPTDWQGVRLLRTADGIYIFGNPSERGPDEIWGVPVCKSTAVVENTAIVGDFAGFTNLYLRRGIQFKVTDAHDDYFIKGKQAIRCDMRCAMVHYRIPAFCKVTGI